MADIKPLVAGNWKMNGLHGSTSEVLRLTQLLSDRPADCDVVVCPPATLVMPIANIVQGYSISVGGQNCHSMVSGAYTGEISAAMLKDAGCTYVIVGHSERRDAAGETDADVRAKASAAHDQNMCSIICVGESSQERAQGATLDVLASQCRGSIPDDSNARNTVIAYEPIWAIGSGNTPSPDEIGGAHDLIRKHLSGRFAEDGREFRILYGGSVKPSNAATLLSANNVNGALVGGASLKSDEFNGIIEAYR